MEPIVLYLLLGDLLLLPFLNFEYLIYLTILNIAILLPIAINDLFNRIRALNIAILGYTIMIFLDMIKFRYIDSSRTVEEDYLILTVYYSYISFFLFILAYSLTTTKFKIKQTNTLFSLKKFNRKIFPLSLFLLVMFIGIYYIDPSLKQNPLLLLVGFLPKATMVVLLLLYLQTKKKYYLVFFMMFLVLTFIESSRRIYITFFLCIVPIIMAYLYYKKINLNIKHKVIALISAIFLFFYLNYLRATHDFGAGYIEGDKLHNTLSYIKSLKSLDTFYNTAFIIKYFPDRYNFYFGETYSSTLFMLLPRAVWEDKPVGFAAPLGVLQTVGSQDFTLELWHSVHMYSLSPGFIGEAYANFGFAGIIFLSLLFGFVSKAFDKSVNPKLVFENKNILPYFAFYGSFFLLLRGDFFSAMYFSVFFFIYLKIIVRWT